MNTGEKIKNLRKSFVYAFKGLIYCLNNERNMRIHLCSTVMIFIIAYLYEITVQQLLFITFACGFVMVCEMLNTSIEAVINLLSPSYNVLAKIAKDTAAGAVMIAALTALIIGAFTFGDLSGWARVIEKLKTNPLIPCLLVTLIAVMTVYVFNGTGDFFKKITKSIVKTSKPE